MKRTPFVAKPHRSHDAIQAARRVVLDRDRESCQAYGLHDGTPCAGRIEVHHIAARSARPDLIADSDNMICLCQSHHRWVGDHPNDAHEVGLHRYSWEDDRKSVVSPIARGLADLIARRRESK